MLHPRLNRQVLSTFMLDKQAGDFGVELEIEGMNLPTKVIGWVVKPENSLRGKDGRVIPNGEGHREDTPLEYITKGAMSYGTLQTRLAGLKAALTEKNTSVNITTRASTHIHLNMQQETFHTCIGFIIAYTIVEPLLLRLCGPQRNGNLFCLPNYETGDLSMHMQQIVRTLTHESPHWPERGKYAALNTDPLIRFGSFEVRCFPNTIEPSEILRWCRWLTNIRRMVTECRDETFRALVDLSYKFPDQTADMIFTDFPGLNRAAAPATISELIQVGAENAYELYKAALPVLDYKEEEKKVRGKKKPQYDPDWVPPPDVDFAPIETDNEFFHDLDEAQI